jgi:methyl-accepting chemotaxis protein
MARRRELLRAADVRRRVGRFMVATGLVGIVTAVIGMAVAWLLVGDVNAATRDTLEVTVESLDSLQATLDLSDGVLSSTSGSLQAVEDSLRQVGPTLTDGSQAVTDVSDLSATAAPSLRDAVGTLRQLEALGGQIDGVLTGVSSVPFGPDYNPDNGLGPTFGRLATNLEPLPQAFDDTSASLDQLGTSLTAMQTQVQTLTDSVAQVNDQLEGSQQLLTDYRDRIDRARTVAVGTRGRLRRDEILLRIVIVIAGLVFAALQLLPLWAGWELLDENADEREPTGPPTT